MPELSLDRKIYQLHAEFCKTVANPIRIEILNLLRQGEKSVNELVILAGIRQATVSQHLAVLRQRGIVSTRKEGVRIYYAITTPRMIKACDMIREVLFVQIADMEKLAKSEAETK